MADQMIFKRYEMKYMLNRSQAGRIAMSETESENYLFHHGKADNTQITREIDYCIAHYKNLDPSVLLSYEREAFYAKDDQILMEVKTGFAITLAMLPAMVCIVIMMVNGNVGAGVAVAGAFSLVRFRSVPGTAKEIGVIFLPACVCRLRRMLFVWRCSDCRCFYVER